MEELSEKEIEEWKDKIDNMSQREMARMWRFSPSGHPVFRSDLPLFDYFQERFQRLGGMTPAISKSIGW